MPKYVSSSLLPYFYKKHQTILTGYEFETGDKFVANNEDVGSYEALAIKRGSIVSEDGTVLNEIEISLDNTTLEFKQMVLSGVLERKWCKVYILFVSSGGSLLGEVLFFHGIMDAPKGDENWVSVTLRPLAMLDRQFPRRIYQIGCNWRFCDENCGLDLEDYDATGSLGSESDGTTLSVSTGQADDYFVPGYVQITSGDYDGEVRPIVESTSGSVTVRVSFGHTIPSGTNVKIQKLCAKNPDACQNEFNNYSEYGGFPTVPKQPVL